jgi:ribulose-5-phosphate 4-epimerase/fuculose-1-phosphate aldolase
MDSLMQDRAGMTDAEWKVRCDLAALYRICDHLGWTDLLDTHMSVRVPGEPTKKTSTRSRPRAS